MDGYSRLPIAFMPGLGRPGNASARSQEKKRRMRTRFTWIGAVLSLVAIGFLLACSSHYKPSSNGLIVVPTLGSAVMQTFSLNLSNGHVSQINNSAGPPTPGLPGQVILDPAGTSAYVIVNQDATLPGSVSGIATFQVGGDGKLSAIGTTSLTSPRALAIDSAGKLLFVANGSAGTVSVFSIGSNASLSEVAGSPFALPTEAGGSPSADALAVTPTVFPIQFAACSGHTAPTTENLYVADSVNNAVLNYSVGSDGTLTLVPVSATQAGAVTGTLPSGVAVDPCGQFVYVANATSNNVSAFTICTAASQNCQQGDYSLQPVTGSPFSAGDLPGPIAVDPFANFVYVVDRGSSQISGYRISLSSGALTAITGTPITTGSGADSIAIRSDGTLIFVANFNAASVSEYAITPATGGLTPQAPFTTLNNPTGVAVK
jgi:6-phosphogluconolactonase (cycloisomerase 2 family)